MTLFRNYNRNVNSKKIANQKFPLLKISFRNHMVQLEGRKYEVDWFIICISEFLVVLQKKKLTFLIATCFGVQALG